MPVKINGQTIEEAEIEQEMQRMRPDYERVFANMEKEKRQQQLREWSIENLIERTLMAQKAAEQSVSNNQLTAAVEQIKRSQGPATENADQAQLTQAVRQRLQTDQLISQICADIGEPAEEQIEKHYEENKSHYKQPEQIRASHIVKHPGAAASESESLAQMQQAKAELDSGALFEKIAQKYSDCPDNGGDLGYFTHGQMVPEFEDVVFNTPPGQTTDVFRTRFGFHIAKVYDRKRPTCPPLKDIRDRVVRELKDQLQREKIEAYLDKLKETATIEQL